MAKCHKNRSDYVVEGGPGAFPTRWAGGVPNVLQCIRCSRHDPHHQIRAAGHTALHYGGQVQEKKISQERLSTTAIFLPYA